MIKILSLIPPVGSSKTYLMHQFFDTLPADFQEVDDAREADVFFGHVNMGGSGVDIYIKGVESHNMKFNLSSISTDTFRQLEAILKIPGILYFDSFGVPRGHSTYPDFVKDIDIPTAPVQLPDHPNFYKTHFVDERSFYISNRYKREPKHLVMLHDQLIREGIAPALAPLLEKGIIEKITVPGNDKIDVESLELHDLQPHVDKIHFISRVRWPDGVRALLNRAEFYISAQPIAGVELMGIEAGMCGAQPIYPDTPYYCEMFEGTDVAFFDIENPTESLDAILCSDFTWDEEERQRFLKLCSGTRNLPKFWEHVQQVLDTRD